MTAGNRFVAALILVFTLGVLVVSAQRNKAQLQSEKQKNLNLIKETEKILRQTSQEKKNTLGELAAVNQRVSQQEALILSIESEIELMNIDITENNEILKALQTDLTRLKEEYAAMVFSAQKTSGGVSKLMFLFAAPTFDQLAMRFKYLEQYSAARKEQAAAIRKVQVQLAGHVLLIEGKKEEKNKLLKEEVSEKDTFEGLKRKQNTIVRSLEKEEKRLRSDLTETKNAIAKLDKLISDIIKEEMARAAREEATRKRRESAKVSEASSLSSSFEENKNKFPWPASGFISQKFGRQNHPVLKGIVLQNDGINIQTAQGERVRTIFAGEVRAVAFIPTLGNSVIISHGDYFTVYSGLKDVTLKKGQKVTSNQEIGRILVNSEGISELRFQIRKNTTALNPESWLRN
ncbi:MAG: peptidoglycan DD-metalloendopeptidase family protein [Cytophagales bacterium]|nr:peptidoglycan DD-metalloendopeptidase family protein [Cytophagales bacterium]